MKSTHTRKEALGTQRHQGRARQGSSRANGTTPRPLETHRDPMPNKNTATPKQTDPLNTGDSFAGLGKMPQRSP